MAHFKSLRLICLSSLTFLMAPGVSLAVGLGSIEITSYLNEPFKAQIPIRTPQEVALSEIQVSLANQEAFERAGIERPFYLTQFDYQVKGNAGEAYIEVTSDEPIRNPFVSFILEANWASGKVQREYTVLIDPVEYQPRQKRVSKVLSTKPHPASASTRPLDSSRVSSTTERHYRVRANDTLSEIAQPVSKSYGADLNQTMIAIARKNPNAFIGGNVNGLKKGATLTLPNESEIFELSSSEALARAVEHERAWKYGQRVSTLPPLDPSPTAPQKALTLVEPTVPAQRVQSIPVPQSAQPQSTQPPNVWSHQPVAQPTDSKTQNRLLMIEETLDTLKQTNLSLQQQQAQLQEQNSQLMTMLSQRENKIEELTQILNQLAQQATDTSVSTSVPNQPLPQGEQGVEDELVGQQRSGINTSAVPAPDPQQASQQEGTATDTKLNRPVASEPLAPVPAPAPTQAVPSQAPEGFSYWWIIVAGLAAFGLAGAGYGMYRKRSLMTGEFESPEEEPVRVEAPYDEDLDEGATTEDIEEALLVFGEDLDNSPDATTSMQSDHVDANEPNRIQEPTPVSSNADLMAEVDVYIAYETFDKAEELLKQHLAANPDDAQAHLRLIEIYDTQQKTEAIQGHLQSLPKDLMDKNPEIFYKIQRLSEVPAFESSTPEPPKESRQESSTLEDTHSPEETNQDFEFKADTQKPESDEQTQEQLSQEDQTQSEEESNVLEFSLAPQEESEPDESEFEEDQSFDLSQEYNLSLDSDQQTKDSDDTNDDSSGQLLNELGDEGSEDIIATKLALAQAYLDLGDKEGAFEHLEEIIKEGSPDQRARAEEMLKKTKDS